MGTVLETGLPGWALLRSGPELRRGCGGVTWQPCGAYNVAGNNSAQALPKWQGGSLYWLVDGALIATDDQAKTWRKISDLKDGRYWACKAPASPSTR